jgi:hypothetical protein
MNEQFNTSDFVVRTPDDSISPVENFVPVADKVPEDGVLFNERPLDETEPVVEPMNEPLVDEIPTYETPGHEIPTVGTVAVASSVDESVLHEAPLGETMPHEASSGTKAGLSAALLNSEESELYRTRWNAIQGKFVDEPRDAVQQADALVSEVIEQITQMFANEHGLLEAQWNQGEDVSTEDLRKALQRYRSFFNRLVV